MSRSHGSPPRLRRRRIGALIIALVAFGCDASAPSPEGTTDDAEVATDDTDDEGEAAQAGAQEPTLDQQIALLESIGYLGTTEAPRNETGVTVHDPERAQAGLNFFASGHAPTAYLMDMEGRILHEWSTSFDQVWPDKKVGSYPKPYFRKAYLYENGDMLGIWEGKGLVKLDKDSNLLWENPDRIHHDLEVLENGDIWVLARKGRLVPRLDPKNAILEDFVVLLDADGKEKRRLSLLEAYEKSDAYREHLERRPSRAGDVFHTNTLALLDGRNAERHPGFDEGNILVAMTALSVLAVLDPREGSIVWSFRKPRSPYHDPGIVGDGNLLVLSNLRVAPSGEIEEESAILEYDLDDMSVAWSYHGTPERRFLTTCCGTVQRLDNGNTLITETTRGRVFEVDPDGVVVWEYLNPHGALEPGSTVFAIPELIRLPEDRPIAWAQWKSGQRPAVASPGAPE